LQQRSLVEVPERGWKCLRVTIALLAK